MAMESRIKWKNRTTSWPLPWSPLSLVAYVVQAWVETVKFGIDVAERTIYYTYALIGATVVVFARLRDSPSASWCSGSRRRDNRGFRRPVCADPSLGPSVHAHGLRVGSHWSNVPNRCDQRGHIRTRRTEKPGGGALARCTARRSVCCRCVVSRPACRGARGRAPHRDRPAPQVATLAADRGVAIVSCEP